MEYKPRPVPPIYFLMTLGLMGVLHHVAPIAVCIRPPLNYSGGLLVVGGIAMAATAAGAFSRADTPVVPFEKTTAIVTSGLYEFTRNPMYLGMITTLVGVAVLLGSASPYLPVPVFAALIHVQFVRREEMFLEDLFGEQYLSYKSRVRRWL